MNDINMLVFGSIFVVWYSIMVYFISMYRLQNYMDILYKEIFEDHEK